jgi:hypothetical protein
MEKNSAPLSPFLKTHWTFAAGSQYFSNFFSEDDRGAVDDK